MIEENGEVSSMQLLFRRLNMMFEAANLSSSKSLILLLVRKHEKKGGFTACAGSQRNLRVVG